MSRFIYLRIHPDFNLQSPSKGRSTVDFVMLKILILCSLFLSFALVLGWIYEAYYLINLWLLVSSLKIMPLMSYFSHRLGLIVLVISIMWTYSRVGCVEFPLPCSLDQSECTMLLNSFRPSVSYTLIQSWRPEAHIRIFTERVVMSNNPKIFFALITSCSWTEPVRRTSIWCYLKADCSILYENCLCISVSYDARGRRRLCNTDAELKTITVSERRKPVWRNATVIVLLKETSESQKGRGGMQNYLLLRRVTERIKTSSLIKDTSGKCRFNLQIK